MLSKVKIKAKLLFLFTVSIALAVAFTAVMLGMVSSSKGEELISKQVSDQLLSVNANKKKALETIINAWPKELIAQQTRGICINARKDYRDFVETGIKSADYIKYTDIIDEHIAGSVFSDMYIIDNDGLIVYSVNKSKDYKTNILTGQYKDSGLGKAAAKAFNGEVSFEDFTPYEPEDNEFCAFYAAPIINKGKHDGVVAFQVSVSELDQIVQVRTGLGKTGESYLVGLKDGITSLRSNRIIKDGKIGDKYSFEILKDAFDGKTDAVKKIGSTGAKEFFAYTPLKLTIKEINWVLATSVAQEEMFTGLREMTGSITTYTFFLIIIMAVLAVIFGWIFSENINKGIIFIVDKIQEIVTNVKNGDLQKRIEKEKIQTDFILVADEINTLIDSFVHPITITEEYLAKIAKGQTPEKITEEYKGDFNKIKQNINNLLEINADIAEAAENIAKGDLTIELKMRSENDKLVQALIEMAGNLKVIITNIKEHMTTIASGSEELSIVSTQLLSGANTTSEQVNGVASATEQLTANVNAIASAVEEINVNISNVSNNSERINNDTNNIASTVEELTQSLKSVASNAENATKISAVASNKSENATAVMNELGAAAKQIGKVTEVIKKIAEQTNLLALNATIEAASAGEAGRGFAVVAKEIKELAKQSAKAADSISDEIENIQAKTTNAVSTITDVSSTIEEVNLNIKEIDKSVQEQTLNSGEIAKTINHNAEGIKSISRAFSEISTGVTDVSRNIGEGAKGTVSISKDIGKVTSVAKESRSGAEQVQNSAQDLAKLAGELQGILSRFKL